MAALRLLPSFAAVTAFCAVVCWAASLAAPTAVTKETSAPVFQTTAPASLSNREASR
jgi:hypothetical protein